VNRGHLICVYQHAPTPGAPGIYRHRLLLSRLARRGWNVDLVSTPVNYMTGTTPPAYAGRLYARETIDGVAHHWVWAADRIHESRKRRAVNYATFATAATLRAATLPAPDIVLASSPPLPVATVGEVVARRFRRPWVLEIRDIWPESAAAVGWLRDNGPAYRVLERVAHRHVRAADAVMTPTPGLVEGIRAHGAADVHVVPGAVIDASLPDHVRKDVRAQLGVADDECLFVYIGALGAANGVDALLDAVERLEENARARVLLVGDGSDRPRLEAQVRERQMTRVSLEGPVPKDVVPSFLAAADVCLHVLRDERVFESALPTKVLEYWGARRPFITTVRGLPERLARESGGSFAGSVDELAEELRRWTRLTPEERARRGEAAYAFGTQHFGVDAAVDELERVLQLAMRGRHA